MANFLRGALAVALIGAGLGACSRPEEATLASPSSTAAVSTTALGGPTTLPVTTPTTATAPPDPCASSGLTLEAGEGRAALGHALYVFEFRNTSTRPCRLLGYPVVAVLDAQGDVLAQAQPAAGFILPDRPPAAVVLASGASGYFGLESANVCEGGVRPTTANTIRVTPPGQASTLTAEATVSVCPIQAVLVSPVRASENDIAR